MGAGVAIVMGIVLISVAIGVLMFFTNSEGTANNGVDKLNALQSKTAQIQQASAEAAFTKTQMTFDKNREASLDELNELRKQRDTMRVHNPRNYVGDAVSMIL